MEGNIVGERTHMRWSGRENAYEMERGIASHRITPSVS